MMISPLHRRTTHIGATLLSLVGLALGGGVTPVVLDAQDRHQSRDSLPDRAQARAEAERSYEPVRRVDPVTKAASIDLVVRGYDAGRRSVSCTNGDSADIVVGLRRATTGVKQELSIYAISVGGTWRYLDAMRVLVDDWLLTPRQVAAPGPELTHYARGVIETSAYVITRRQLVLIARAKSVQIRLIGAGGLCDLALDPVDQELIGLFVERELASSPRVVGSGAPSLGQAQPLRVTARIRSTSTSNRKGLAR
jgi:hypothetical protein